MWSGARKQATHSCTARSNSEKVQHQDLILFLIGSGFSEIDCFNKKGETALHQAVERNCLSMVRALTELGADLNLPTKPGEVDDGGGSSSRTPLMLTCKSEKLLRICKYLVEAKADINLRSGALGEFFLFFLLLCLVRSFSFLCFHFDVFFLRLHLLFQST